MKSLPKGMEFDKRLLKRNQRSGLISKAQVSTHFEGLKNMEDNIEDISSMVFKSLEGEPVADDSSDVEKGSDELAFSVSVKS